MHTVFLLMVYLTARADLPSRDAGKAARTQHIHDLARLTPADALTLAGR